MKLNPTEKKKVKIIVSFQSEKTVDKQDFEGNLVMHVIYIMDRIYIYDRNIIYYIDILIYLDIYEG